MIELRAGRGRPPVIDVLWVLELQVMPTSSSGCHAGSTDVGLHVTLLLPRAPSLQSACRATSRLLAAVLDVLARAMSGLDHPPSDHPIRSLPLAPTGSCRFRGECADVLRRGSSSRPRRPPPALHRPAPALHRPSPALHRHFGGTSAASPAPSCLSPALAGLSPAFAGPRQPYRPFSGPPVALAGPRQPFAAFSPPLASTSPVLRRPSPPSRRPSPALRWPFAGPCRPFASLCRPSAALPDCLVARGIAGRFFAMQFGAVWVHDNILSPAAQPDLVDKRRIDQPPLAAFCAQRQCDVVFRHPF